ncbi:MAG TPA: hypothetical protein DEP72_05785 [Clostridiales bacterium]|nr:MAG: hypothetical protein A2Y18_06260 [Clostridiales bacterium GWD2_32_19]HCC07652.1 hypothetical protein [Clostridiales bacterium]
MARCFDENHFLIKSMKGEIGDFGGYNQLKENNFNIFNYTDNFSLNFCVNLSRSIGRLCKCFTEADIRKFVENQLSAGKENYDEAQFFRALSEIEILNYFGSYGPHQLSQAVYEPSIGSNGRNPEARFYYEDGTILDIEVKTPGFTNFQYDGEMVIPCILLDKQGRDKLIKYSEDNNLKIIMPRVLKLIEFINNAASKFEKPTSNKHLNLLYINWTYSEFPSKSYLEAYSLLYNEFNGLLKYKELGIKMGILEDAYEKISGIIVYTSSLNTLVFQEFRYLWSTRCFSIMPLECDETQLIKTTSMDYKKNVITPNLLCEVRGNTIDEKTESMVKFTHINEIIESHALK